MSDRPKVVSIEDRGLMNVSQQLRGLADSIERGDYGAVTVAVVVVEEPSTGLLGAFAFGPCDPVRAAGLLLKAATMQPD